MGLLRDYGAYQGITTHGMRILKEIRKDLEEEATPFAAERLANIESLLAQSSAVTTHADQLTTSGPASQPRGGKPTIGEPIGQSEKPDGGAAAQGSHLPIVIVVAAACLLVAVVLFLRQSRRRRGRGSSS